MPAPVMFNESPGLESEVTVKALAPELNTISFTSVLAERETPVILDALNVAVSEGPFGTDDGVQFAAVFQSPELGLVFHVALPAKAPSVAETASAANIASRRNVRGNILVLCVNSFMSYP
jgi:hypothetical protein